MYYDPMRKPIFEPKAAKATVSLTLNSDLYAKAKSLGINASRVAEQALAEAYAEKRAKTLREELEQDLQAADHYTSVHGSFSALVRQHFEEDDGSV